MNDYHTFSEIADVLKKELPGVAARVVELPHILAAEIRIERRSEYLSCVVALETAKRGVEYMLHSMVREARLKAIEDYGLNSEIQHQIQEALVIDRAEQRKALEAYLETQRSWSTVLDEEGIPVHRQDGPLPKSLRRLREQFLGRGK